MKKTDLPKKIAVFPLSNFIIFPKTTVPLNIFEPRYIDMINDSMRSNKLIGMIQPKSPKNDDNEKIPELHEIGCLGKITGFKETDDKRYLIELKGIIWQIFCGAKRAAGMGTSRAARQGAATKPLSGGRSPGTTSQSCCAAWPFLNQMTTIWHL